MHNVGNTHAEIISVMMYVICIDGQHTLELDRSKASKNFLINRMEINIVLI